MSYNKEEITSIWNFIKGSLLVGVFGFLTSPFMFPIAWLFKNKGVKSLFWIWMDDERINEDEWALDYSSYIIRNGGSPTSKENFLIAWSWHIRNSVWNLKRSKFLVESTPSKIGNNNIDVVKVVTDKLYKRNHDDKLRGDYKTYLKQDGVWVIDAGLKFIPKFPEEDIWQVNQGEEISYVTSILGEGFIWFYAKGKDKLMFRYSQCRIVEYKIFGIRIWKGWRTIKIGYGSKSYVLTLKFQKIKPWK